MRRGSLISFLRLLAVLPAAFGSLPVLPAPAPTTAGSDQLQLPPPLPARVNSLFPSPTPTQDAILVAAPDGTIYQVDFTSGKILWSFSSGSPIYDSHQALDSEVDEYNSSRQRSNTYLDCGDDWQLYIHRRDSKPQKLAFSAEELVGRTPLISPDRVLLGSKKTTIFLIDPRTGRVVSTIKEDGESVGQNSIVAKKDAEKWKKPTAAESEPVDHDQLLYIKRFDYRLTYSSSTTGNVLWYLMFADFEASRECDGMDNFLGRIEGGSDDTDDAALPEYCLSDPVYRARDHRELESLLMSKLRKSLRGKEMLSLPPPDDEGSALTFPAQLERPLIGSKIPSQIVPYPPMNRRHAYDVLSLPAQPWIQQNDEAGKFPMLPAPVVEEHRTNINIPPENPVSLHVWLRAFLVAVFTFFVALIFYLGNLVKGKHNKLNKQANDINLQSVISKKKKGRKSGNSKLGTSIEKRKKDISHDNAAGELQYAKRTEMHSLLTFETVNGLVHGRKIGKLLVFDKEIAKGSNGTIVLEGIYDTRPVAVKRLVKVHHDVALKEIQNLILSDQHPNIVRWYGVEYDQDFVYISLERCTCSLHDLILSHASSCQNQTDSSVQFEFKIEAFKDFKLWKANGYPSPQLLKVMRDTVNGLAHLHELGIIHRDLKPQNVLIRKDNTVSAKVSDMGISKRLSADMSSLTKNATGYGSSGWQAPEQLRQERQTRAVDLFSLGCLLFFCITGGRHPFGDALERDINIVNDKKDLFLVENIPEAFDLISQLLDTNPEFRPKAAEVLHHPFFWDPEMRLSFLRDASDRVELEDREAGSDLLKELESVGAVALGGKWDEKMDNTLLSDIGRYRKYKYDSMRDLLRVIRNKLNHYRELPREIRGVLGQVPTGFESYFNSRFPKLLMEVYKVLQKHCEEEEFLHKYYRNTQF